MIILNHSYIKYYHQKFHSLTLRFVVIHQELDFELHYPNIMLLYQHLKFYTKSNNFLLIID